MKSSESNRNKKKILTIFTITNVSFDLCLLLVQHLCAKKKCLFIAIISFGYLVLVIFFCAGSVPSAIISEVYKQHIVVKANSVYFSSLGMGGRLLIADVFLFSCFSWLPNSNNLSLIKHIRISKTFYYTHLILL